MRSAAILATGAALLATAALAQAPATTSPTAPATPGAPTAPPSPGTQTPTGSSNPAMTTRGNAPSTTTTTGEVTIVPMSALEKGANSFTEGQAKSRLEGAGFTGVTGLTKDDDGIWRAKAMAKDGKPVDVGVDYKGNIASS
ncbi:PepSY domain-containing protein [Enterovirga rhinocerotis]|uniref:YpeB-like protein with putative protease inhibitory function n=1 Tax=Enterovirga rhinocerotis TaxID=1339210 RepID=A0A4R7BUI2_9HYPH|nr:PepSY domain-containing protein [Enterovirga rhinocerotis]TDR89161.1 YpeB-like protein with putative protease inhibitory function [Enterovirga rhinocerotis]